MKSHAVDAILLVLAVVFFGLFFAGTVFVERYSGISGTVGWLDEGAAKVKVAGATGFQPGTHGMDLYNLDAVWAGKGQTATIRMVDGSRLALTEKTLVVLKAPFNRFLLRGHKHKSEDFRLIDGELEFRQLNTSKSLVKKRPLAAEKPEPTLSPSPTPIPTLTPVQEPSSRPEVSPVGVFPEVGQTLVMTTDQGHDVVFSWTQPVSGTFLLAQKDGPPGQKTSLPVTNQKSLKVHVPSVSGIYEWGLSAEGGKAGVGPYTFKVRKVSPKDLSSLISKEKTLDSFIIF